MKATAHVSFYVDALCEIDGNENGMAVIITQKPKPSHSGFLVSEAGPLTVEEEKKAATAAILSLLETVLRQMHEETGAVVESHKIDFDFLGKVEGS